VQFIHHRYHYFTIGIRILDAYLRKHTYYLPTITITTTPYDTRIKDSTWIKTFRIPTIHTRLKYTTIPTRPPNHIAHTYFSNTEPSNIPTKPNHTPKPNQQANLRKWVATPPNSTPTTTTRRPCANPGAKTNTHTAAITADTGATDTQAVIAVEDSSGAGMEAAEEAVGEMEAAVVVEAGVAKLG
jgi:hypothetical protein